MIVRGRTLRADGVLVRRRLQASYPVVARVDALNLTVFAWRAFDGVEHHVQARARTTTSAEPMRRKTVSVAGTNASAPRLGVDAAGNALIVWSASDGTNSRIRLRVRSAAGVWNDVEKLSVFGQDAVDPQIAVDAAGNAVIVWTRFDGANNRVQIRRRAADGTLSAVQTLSVAGFDASAPRVAVTATGDAVVTWVLDDGANSRVQVRTRADAGVRTAIATLSSPGEDAFSARVAAEPGGNAIVVYETGAGVIVGHTGP